MTSTLHAELTQYTGPLGFGLVHLPAGKKYPIEDGWQDSPITVFEEAEKVWYRGGNVGLVHAYSGTAVLDTDHPEWTVLALLMININLEDVLAAPGPKIRSAKGLKPLYRLPEGLELTRKALTWHKPGAEKATTVFELRAGKVQDVLPPSIHPDTGKPYVWEPGPPRSREEIPELPGNLRALWENWDVLKPVLMAAWPWHTEKPAAPKKASQAPRSECKSIIDAFNNKHDVHTLLHHHGYECKADRRYLSPHSSTGTPGITILKGDDGVERVFCHHASDPLTSDHSHDAFSLYTILEHSGLGTGMRPGEALALMWKDLDPVTCTIHVQRATETLKGRTTFKPPKTPRSRRSIKMPEQLVQLLLEYKGHGLMNGPLMFPSFKGTVLNERNVVLRHFKPLLPRAGLPTTVRLYDLRHTHATLLLKVGVHLKIVSERLGHSSIALTADTYSHVLPGMQDEAASKLNTMLFKSGNGEPASLN